MTNFYDTRGMSTFKTTGMASFNLSSFKNLPVLTRSESVPTIGLNRAEAQSRLTRTSSSGRLNGGSPASPTADEKKEREKELNAEAASRRLWAAAHGCEVYMKEYGELRKEDPSIKMAACPVPMISKALKQGAKLDWRNPEWDGGTLLLKAVRTDSLLLAEYLISVGADPLVLDNSGRGVFHWAAMTGNPALLEYLMGAVPQPVEPHINLKDSGGDSPLHLGAYYGHLPIVRQLVFGKADPKQENEQNFSPAELAEVRRMWHVVTYLTESKLQKEDEECPKEEFKIRNLTRTCNLSRANALNEIAKLNPKPKPKANAKGKAKK